MRAIWTYVPGEIRCEGADRYVYGWVVKTPAGQWIAKVEGNLGTLKTIGRHVSKRRALVRMAEYNGVEPPQ